GDDPAQGHVPQPHAAAVAGPVRERAPDAVRAQRRGGRAEPGPAERTVGPVRLRGQARPHRGAPAGGGRAGGGRGGGRGDRARRRRAGGDRRPAPSRPRIEGEREACPHAGNDLVNVAELFIRRPVATTLVMLAILVAGIGGYALLPVSDLPTVDFPTLQVSASLPGASPETMAAAVATPLEKQFSTIAGL